VGTIGSVWQKSTPSKETTGPAQTRKAKRYENEEAEMRNGARAAFACWLYAGLCIIGYKILATSKLDWFVFRTNTDFRG